MKLKKQIFKICSLQFVALSDYWLLFISGGKVVKG